MSGKAIFRGGKLARRVAGGLALARVLVFGTSLLLGACTGGNTGKKDNPVVFGNAGGGNGGAGATSGMSFSW